MQYLHSEWQCRACGGRITGTISFSHCRICGTGWDWGENLSPVKGVCVQCCKRIIPSWDGRRSIDFSKVEEEVLHKPMHHRVSTRACRPREFNCPHCGKDTTVVGLYQVIIQRGEEFLMDKDGKLYRP